MLRRAENVGISFSPNFFTGNGWLIVSIGKQSYRVGKLHKNQVADASAAQLRSPVRVVRVGDRTYWQYQNKFYWDNDELTADEVYALLVTRQQRERQRIDRAQAIVAMGQEPRSNHREFIPDDVKQFVWARDSGRCRNCGGTSELQFDHIIPRVMGGGSVAENLQILCGPCNRRKGPGLSIR